MSTKTIREKLLVELEDLPSSSLQEALDFVVYLKAKEGVGERVKAELDPEADPILGLIGIADVKPFADNIDQELYGE